MTARGSKRSSTLVTVRPPSVIPHMLVASEPANVLGTATTGIPMSRATILASPVADPPPTESTTSEPCCLAISTAARALSAGTCWIASRMEAATGTRAANSSAVLAADPLEMSNTRRAPSPSTAASAFSAARHLPNSTHWADVVWSKAMPMSVLLFALAPQSATSGQHLRARQACRARSPSLGGNGRARSKR